MNASQWLKQTKDKPLFENLLWSRPENKNRAGKLLIIGGNSHGFAAPAQSYALAERAGAGAIKVILPDSLKRSVGTSILDTVFSPSNKIGSFGQQSMSDFLEYANWSDLCLLCGDFGRNSETAILVESFATKFSGKLAITKDASNLFFNSSSILNRPDSLLVLNLGELQKVLKSAHYPKAITASMTIQNRVEALAELTMKYVANIITYYENTIFIAVNGKVATTEAHLSEELWELPTACYTSVWWMQNSERAFEAFATACYVYQHDILNL